MRELGGMYDQGDIQKDFLGMVVGFEYSNAAYQQIDRIDANINKTTTSWV